MYGGTVLTTEVPELVQIQPIVSKFYMSQQVIDRITTIAREESADVNASVLKKIVPQARRTFAIITPMRQIGFSKMFFSRQMTAGEETPERWNIYGRFLWFLAGVYFTNRKRGELMIDHLMTFVGWLRQASEDEKPIIVRRDFWQIDEDTACLRAARYSAKAAGDERRVLDLSQQIAANEREVLECQRAAVYAGSKEYAG